MSKKNKKRGTFIHGIGASQALDSSGERIIIDGVDISNLIKDGTFNYEHKNENSTQIVGKILEAKKILKRADCETDDHRYFWDKVRMPYIYVAGELFDAVGHTGAHDVAAMLKYDAQGHDNEEAKNLINFSIEGAVLDKQGHEIVRCLARKITVTITPCNKTAIAELKIDTPNNGDKFKVLNNILMNKGEQSSSVQLAKAENIIRTKLQGSDNYKPITTATGEHREGKTYQPKRTFTNTNAPKQLKVGDRITYPKNNKPLRAPTGKEIYGKSEDSNKKLTKKLVKEFKADPYGSNMRKAVTAGMGVGTPSTATQGEAIAKNEVLKHLANESFTNFPKRKELIKFLNEKMPNLSKKEILALTKTITYTLEQKKIRSLKKLTKK